MIGQHVEVVFVLVPDPLLKLPLTRQGLLATHKLEDSLALAIAECCERGLDRVVADCCFDLLNLALSATARALRVTNGRN